MDEKEFFQQLKRRPVAPVGPFDVRAAVWREIDRLEAAGRCQPLSLWRDVGAQAMMAAGLAVVVGAGLLAVCYGHVAQDIDWMSSYLGWVHRVLPLV